MSSRHMSRHAALQILYAWEFNNKQADLAEVSSEVFGDYDQGVLDKDFVSALVVGVKEHLEEIDNIIIPYCNDGPFENVSILDKSILRLGVYELMILKDVPPKVAIDEAVEVAKSFGGEGSAKLASGILGKLYEVHFAENEKPTE